ncbi:hypothetical protein ACHAQH_004116 [Verticillium albo-atrum]
MPFSEKTHHYVLCTCSRAAGDCTGKHRRPQYNEKCEATDAIGNCRSGGKTPKKLADEDVGEYDDCSHSQGESQDSIISSDNTLCENAPDAAGNQSGAVAPGTTSAAFPGPAGQAFINTTMPNVPVISIDPAGSYRSAASVAHGTGLTAVRLALHTRVIDSVPRYEDAVVPFLHGIGRAIGGSRDHMPLPPTNSSSLQVSPEGSSRSSIGIGPDYCPGDASFVEASQLAGAGNWADEPFEYFTMEDLSTDLAPIHNM